MPGIAPGHATDVTSDPNGVRNFADYTALVARTFPDVKDFIIGNEPNLGNFWAPTYNSKGAIVSGASYEAALAASYDALKAVRPHSTIYGADAWRSGLSDTSGPSISSSPWRSGTWWVRDCSAS